MINYKQYIKSMVEQTNLGLENVEVVRPPKEEMGDYAIPCFNLNFDNLKNPNEKAHNLLKKLKYDKSKISKIEVMGPYLNISLNRDYLSKQTLTCIMSEKNEYGSSRNGVGKKFLIEHTSINPNASPHIGRSRNSIIGDFIVRLYKFEGYEVESNYFINDIGKQISMLLVGIEQNGNIDTITFKDMLDLYVKINEESKNNSEIEARVFEYLNRLENGDEEIRSKFKYITDICVKGQQQIFEKMNIKWDVFTHESDFVFGNVTEEILNALRKKGKLKEDELGRLYVDLTGYDIPTKSPVLVLTREDKTSLYPLRDIAYTISKIKKNDVNNYIVLGEDQEVYMKQISATLDILGYNAPSLISYSFVLLNGDKMATREGKVVLLEDFIEEAKNKILIEFKDRNNSLSEEKNLSLAASCIKYGMLNINRKRNVNFNLEEAVNFHGNSAIYLIYNYARINSILEKANDEIDPEIITLKDDIEYSIIKMLYDFPEVIQNTLLSHESIEITKYLHQLTQKFSKYYESVNFLNENDEEVRKSRLLLLKSIKTVLENGMNILGIEPQKKL